MPLSGAADPGQPGKLPSKRPPVQQEKVVPHTDFRGTAQPAPAGPGTGERTATVWPAAGEADVDLGAVAAATAKAAPDAAPPPESKAGGLPVRLKPSAAANSGMDKGKSASAKTPGRVHVRVLDHGAAVKAGVAGVLFTVAPDAAGPLSVELDYTAFRDAGGAGLGDRLRLVELPACALTTPEAAECQVQTPVTTSRNDAKAGVLTADVTTKSAAPQGASGVAATGFAAGGMVLAAAPDASGPSGSFASAPISPSGSWTAGGSTGDFSWGYPVPVPPPGAGGDVAPDVSLAYSSSSVDGRVTTTNNQSTWIGEGWDYNPGFVERTYRTCADDPAVTDATKTQDLCWAGQIVTLNLKGKVTSLVRDDATGAWHGASDAGLRVELLTGAANGAHDGEYWKVTTTDGVQYFFGKNEAPGRTTQPTTNSTWTVPVYGAHSGEPCYSSAGFGSSSCLQAWRWSLDYIEDPHGNAAVNYYNAETNYYGANKGTTGVLYTRGGTIARMEYGLHKENGSVYGRPAADQIVFNLAERCVPSGAVTCDPAQFTKDNAKSWPDTPQDQDCKQGAVCNNHAPSFWSTKRLVNITTQVANGSGGYRPVDAIDLQQQFPATGDPEMLLSSITRTGYAADGVTKLALPPVTFTSQLMDNRVLNYNNQPAMPHWRLTNVTTDTGSVVWVTYSQPDCTAATVPTDLPDNTTRCYPVYWTRPYATDPTLDFFHKYVVTQVAVSDSTGVTPKQVTSYSYVGAPAWHYDDDELTKPKERTYGQFRGYGQVETRTGDPQNNVDGKPDALTLQTATYFRGMDGDTLPNNGTRHANVTNSLGESVPDNPAFSGEVYESRTFNGDGGAQLSSTVTDPVVVGTTGSRARPGLPALVSTVTGTARSRSITNLAAGGVRTVSQSNQYDALGRLIRSTASGDGLADLCTTTNYAENTVSWIRDRLSEKTVSAQVCPPLGTPLSNVTWASRNYYDGQATLGAVPGAGDPTGSETASANNSGVLTYVPTATNTFDAFGRTSTAADALGRTSRMEYTPSDGGNVTQITSTNPANQKTYLYAESGRGKTTATVDVAGHRTDAVYDALGRVTSLWNPGHDKATQPASVTYTYLQRTDGPSAVTTKTFVDYGTGTNYATKVMIYDALGQIRQVQEDAEGGGRIVQDAVFDSHGWKVKTNNRYYTSGSPTTTLISVADSAVDDRSVNTFDGSGRVINEAVYKGLSLSKAQQTVYGGDRVTTIPPTGGVVSTTVSGADGKALEAWQYTSPPTVSGAVVSGGTHNDTRYHYSAVGDLDKITDAAGNEWTFTNDMLGHTVSQTDPDTGTSTSTYDNAGQLLTLTDGRQQTLAFTYDSLGRKTAEYAGSTAGTKLASWTWDTLQAGRLSYSTRYTPGGNYLRGYSGYDLAGNPRGEVVQIPAGETGLGGTYTTTYGYTSTGLLTSLKPAAGGGLPGEQIGITYSPLGKPLTSIGYNAYVSASTYTPYGEESQYTLGPSNNPAWLTFNRDAQTRRVTGVNLSAQQAVPQIDDTTYTYDVNGRLTRTTDVQGAPGSPTETQCFGYDALDRLTQAWTATDNCAGAPSTAPGATNIGGPQPYWTSWSIDATGMRTGQVKHALPGATGGDTTTTYTYPQPKAAQAHTLTSSSTTGPTGTANASYTYDGSGNTLTRTLPTGPQTLTWSLENKLDTVTTAAGTTSYVYDADGAQLVRRDPGVTKLFLVGEELSRDTATGKVTGTRYYSHDGQTVAMRVGGANPQYVVADLHNTAQVTANSTGFGVTRRQMDPYGNQVGQTAPLGPWPDTHGFLDKPVDDATGLTDIGARKYDASTGRFISRDPVNNHPDPTQFNGYAYGGDNPVNNADPTGLGFGSWVKKHAAKIAVTVAVVTVVVAVAVVAAPVVLPVAAAAAEAATTAAATAAVATETSAAAGVAAAAAEGAGTAFLATGGSATMAAVGAAGSAASAACTVYCTATGLVTVGVAAETVSAFAGSSNSVRPGRGCGPNSFVAGTPVLMADGTTKAIEQVRVGDEIANAEPGDGTPQHHTVTDVVVTDDDVAYVDLTVGSTADQGTVTTTAHHLFYDLTTGRWTEAEDLRIGDELQTPGGRAKVLASRHYTTTVRTYNLTIDAVHTYFVVAGGVPVLVHNTGPCELKNASTGAHREEEITRAKNEGVAAPAKPGTAQFQSYVEMGDGLIKWGVRKDGTLVIVPQHVGEEEIAHTALNMDLQESDDVLVAVGEGRIRKGPGGSFVIEWMNDHSGHYQKLNPCSCHQAGKEAFQKAGIRVDRSGSYDEINEDIFQDEQWGADPYSSMTHDEYNDYADDHNWDGGDYWAGAYDGA
ncbi:RHS repeat-associated core domain-containing protein [Yinghuangia seranimata]|uniref:RHS repeat-associated core domain-containing protein n=1 Tax=Yinghuangia seranimata TaxID=408067 RepID=UPI00248B3E49|nr:RHS repeat-associated core domain-containing protein [Yinghuangia seranimata]MDI2131608.1 RHS repeat-associated core domain-containing protein [Yinghuangia seranimata]